jgi:Protein of unknown function (DUF2997)
MNIRVLQIHAVTAKHFARAKINRSRSEDYRPMSMETLEFVIYPDGRVQEKVTGVVGQSCTVVTAAIEAELGHVVDREQTADYFAAKVEQSVTASNQATW